MSLRLILPTTDNTPRRAYLPVCVHVHEKLRNASRTGNKESLVRIIICDRSVFNAAIPTRLFLSKSAILVNAPAESRC